MKRLVIVQKASISKEDVSRDIGKEVANKVQVDSENQLTIYEHCAAEVIVSKKRPKVYARCLQDM